MARHYPNLALIAVIGSLAGSTADAAGPSPSLNIHAPRAATAFVLDRANTGRFAREPQADQSVRPVRAGNNRPIKPVK